MNIQPINSYNISMQGNPRKAWDRFTKKITQKILDVTPEATYKNGTNNAKNLSDFDNLISRPDVNRGILGFSAFFTQPAIDSLNHRVDDDTREVSKNRTKAKVIAGTGVGIFVVRGPLYSLIEKMTNLDGDSRFAKTLLPKKYMKEIENNPKFLKNYRSALAMALVLAANCVTNFVLDAPLTIYLTNKFNEKSREKGRLKNKTEVNNV